MKIKLILTALLALGAAACTSDRPSAEDLQKQEAAKARVEVGIAYLYQGDMAQAKANLDKAAAHAPNYYLVHSALAYFYRVQGNVENANEEYLTAIKLDDKQGDTFNDYGSFLCSQGQFEKSYEQFNLALKAPNYYRQAATYENFAICAYSAQNTVLYQENLGALQKVDAVRAEKLKKSVAQAQK